MRERSWQIGSTPLRRFPFDDTEIWIKDESANEVTHTHKDRRSLMIVRRALDQNMDALVLITAGNAGASIARIAQGTRLRVVAIVDDHIAMEEIRVLTASGAEVRCIDLEERFLSSQDIMTCAALPSSSRACDVTNGMEQAYEPLLDEIVQQKPDVQTIVAPVGSGELLAGIRERIDRLGLSVRTLGVGVEAQRSLADKLSAVWAPVRSKLTGRLGKQDFLLLSENDIRMMQGQTPKGLDAELSALVTLHAVQHLGDLDRTVFINTGRGPASHQTRPAQ